MILSKTDYLVYRECKKNAWMKIHRFDVYSQYPLSEFDQLLMRTGNDVDLIARNLFPSGILIEDRNAFAQATTLSYIQKKQSVLFQAVFQNEGFIASVDILEFNSETNSYSIYEVKAKNKIDEKIHFYDLAFQVNLLRKAGLKIEKINLIHLNKEYVRSGQLDFERLFTIEDVTEKIESLCEEVAIEMDSALVYLSEESLSSGFCMCVYKGRSNHCTCFSILNPDIPEYSIHDIARIGSSKKKLADLVDGKTFRIHEIPVHIKLSTIQQNQIDVHKQQTVLIEKESITNELKNLVFPLYFIDYETFPCGIPRFDGFSPYDQIPFQYVLYILKSPDVEPELLEFIHTDSDDPSVYFADSLKKHIGNTGSVIVWNKTFECGINTQMGARLKEVKEFMDSLNERVYDLEDIFTKQYFVHKDFRGKTSIKNILPVVVPTLSYKELGIQNGGSAAESWNRLFMETISQVDKEKIIQDLKTYCGRDAYAMYAIWLELGKLI